MSLAEWNARYRAGEQFFETPSPLVAQSAAGLKPGAALDVACGPGRNALCLAERGWRVTAVDGSPLAIELLTQRAQAKNLTIATQIADLERGEFAIEPEAYDLICDCHYLQRDLISQMKSGLRPGGTIIVIVHLADADQPKRTPTRACPGELRAFFTDWNILHHYEGRPNESCHQRSVAEIVARKPD